MQNNNRVLVVDDEPDILDLLKYNLEREGYEVEIASNGEEAIKKAEFFKPELILLDIMMPKMDGVETCRLLREMPDMKDSYIIFLTARAEEYSEVAAFDVGADDYLNKPIKPRALMSRINALFRREFKKQQTQSHEVIEIADLCIDKTSYTLQKEGELIALPKKEFELIYFLAQTPNKVYNREDLLKNIWGQDVYVLARTVDVHIRRIREKIGDNYIKTVKGVGYKFMSPDEI
ncbi:response regulator with CheY-like receiver domain and winged-helix DNA-binding domain [Bernardetia litoralis DSM 6794]|uniref:Phosphate regulon transcriptional regulatory protein PhoB n=1 Tax=Bernardetia litoralis (strain ATCC 23117 / DSM 6794 / NBRC 15988 / NCIMB 1366 / Fx l1 / Sio-4) TaxID=880071 RepID=I4AJK2_BERLS|nr:response regulator transcription factor [Bernardetia litoralis]AFM04137.1 response regulator with CheY-like receiver domain and winged-helix DNA-binding domain [Bernardetia litoralis DSM 6794]